MLIREDREALLPGRQQQASADPPPFAGCWWPSQWGWGANSLVDSPYIFSKIVLTRAISGHFMALAFKTVLFIHY